MENNPDNKFREIRIQKFKSILKDEQLEKFEVSDLADGKKVAIKFKNGIECSVISNSNISGEDKTLWQIKIDSVNPYVSKNGIIPGLDPSSALSFLKGLEGLSNIDKNEYSLDEKEIKTIEDFLEPFSQDEKDTILDRLCYLYEEEKFISKNQFSAILMEDFDKLGFFPNQKSEVLSVIKQVIRENQKPVKKDKKSIFNLLK